MESNLRDIEVSEVAVIRYRPGDRILVTVPTQITSANAEYIKEQVRERFPGCGDVLVLVGGATLEIIRADTEP